MKKFVLQMLHVLSAFGVREDETVVK